MVPGTKFQFMLSWDGDQPAFKFRMLTHEPVTENQASNFLHAVLLEGKSPSKKLFGRR